MSDFGARLKRILEQRNLSQKELAEMSGTTGATISRYVNEDRIPNADFLLRIAEALNVSVDYLLGNTSGKTHTQSLAIKKDKVAISVMGYGAKQEVKYIDRDKYDKIKATLDILFSEE